MLTSDQRTWTKETFVSPSILWVLGYIALLFILFAPSSLSGCLLLFSMHSQYTFPPLDCATLWNLHCTVNVLGSMLFFSSSLVLLYSILTFCIAAGGESRGSGKGAVEDGRAQSTQAWNSVQGNAKNGCPSSGHKFHLGKGQWNAHLFKPFYAESNSPIADLRLNIWNAADLAFM